MADFLKQAEGALQGQEGQDILKQAEGLVGGGQQQGQSTPTTGSAGSEAKPTTGSAGTGKTDYKEVYGSAQTLFQGIQDKAAGKSDVSNEQLASSADDILKAAQNSGLDKNNQYGQYFDKAESFLAKYKGEGGAKPEGGATGAPTKTDTDAPSKTDPEPTKTDASS